MNLRIDIEHPNLYWMLNGTMRPWDYPIAPNLGSFDVYSRLFTLANDSSDGGQIKYTEQQWFTWRKKNGFVKSKADWAVGDTRQLLSWKEDGSWPYPVFHYPLAIGGNFVNVLETKGKFARIATWPQGEDVPEDLPAWYWNRCWCVYQTRETPIRDAPAGVNHVAVPVYNLMLAHSESAWIYNAGLERSAR